MFCALKEIDAKMNEEANKTLNELEISALLWNNKKAKRINLQLSVCGLSNVNIEQETHYLIYRMDNVVNGKYYIGQHETIDIFDGYSGSGFYLNRAQEKYGLSSFVKTLLYDFSSFEEMNAKEKELVQLSNCFPYDPMSYNLKEGGSQGRLSEYSLRINREHCKQTWKQKTSEEREKYSKECSKRLSGKGNPMYGRDWRKGKNKEEIELHGRRISEGHKRRTIEQKRKSKEKERISKENRPQELKDLHSLKCANHARDMWNNPEIRNKILTTRKNTSQEEKDKSNKKRSDTVNAYWNNHPEMRKKTSERLSGSGNPMYGRRKMNLISDPSVHIIVKPEDFCHYLDLGYEFTNKNYIPNIVNNNCNEERNQRQQT